VEPRCGLLHPAPGADRAPLRPARTGPGAPPLSSPPDDRPPPWPGPLRRRC